MSCHSSHGDGGADRADARAVMEVLLAHRVEFVDFAAARMEGRAAAEDVVQEALTRALESAAQLRAGEAALAWFYRILRNAIIDRYRRRASSDRNLELLAAEVAAVEAAGLEPERRVCRCVSHLAEGLKPEYAEALRRVEIDGAPVKALAEELGITANNAAVRVFRAREALRKKVMTTCRECAEAGCLDCTCGPAGDG